MRFRLTEDLQLGKEIFLAGSEIEVESPMDEAVVSDTETFQVTLNVTYEMHGASDFQVGRALRKAAHRWRNNEELSGDTQASVIGWDVEIKTV